MNRIYKILIFLACLLALVALAFAKPPAKIPLWQWVNGAVRTTDPTAPVIMGTANLNPSAAPGWQGKDSDCTDADVNAQWYTDCIVTTSGGEICYFAVKTQNQGAENFALVVGGREAITANGALTPWATSALDSSGGVLSLTLGDGNYPGQLKTISMSVAGNNADLSVTNHATSDPEVFRFDAVDESLMLVWTGTEWATLLNVGAVGTP